MGHTTGRKRGLRGVWRTVAKGGVSCEDERHGRDKVGDVEREAERCQPRVLGQAVRGNREQPGHQFQAVLRAADPEGDPGDKGPSDEDHDPVAAQEGADGDVGRLHMREE